MAARAPLSLLAALLLAGFADEWFTYFPFGGLEPIRADLGLSYAQMGVALGSLTAGGLLGHFFRVAADFVDRRLLASLGALGVAAGMLLFGLGHSLPVLAAAGFAWGAATDAFFTGCEVSLVDLCEEDELAVALGRMNAYGAVGDLLGPLTLAGALAAGLPWRAVFVFGAAAMALYAAALAGQRFPKPKVEPPEAPAAAVLSVLRDPRVLLLAVVDGLHGLLDEPLLGFLNAYLERARGWTPAAATALISLIVAAGLCGYLAAPLVRRRLRHWPLPRPGKRRPAGSPLAPDGRRRSDWSLPRLGKRRPAGSPLASDGRRRSDWPLLRLFAAGLAASLAALVVAPAAWAAVLAGVAFGFVGAVFYAVLEATYLGLRPGQAGTTGAVVSAIGMAGIGFPALVGAVSDAYGLAVGLGVYALAPVVMLVLLLLARDVDLARPRSTHLQERAPK